MPIWQLYNVCLCVCCESFAAIIISSPSPGSDFYGGGGGWRRAINLQEILTTIEGQLLALLLHQGEADPGGVVR